MSTLEQIYSFHVEDLIFCAHSQAQQWALFGIDCKKIKSLPSVPNRGNKFFTCLALTNICTRFSLQVCINAFEKNSLFFEIFSFSFQITKNATFESYTLCFIQSYYINLDENIYFNTLAQQKNFTRQISECPCSSNKTFILKLMYCALFSQRILARNHSYFFCSKSSSQSRTKETSDRSGLSAQSSLSIFPQKYLYEDTYFILQNI